MKIPVRTNINSFFWQVVCLMSSFAPIKALTNSERKLLTELLILNYKYRKLTERERRILLFSTENRRFIRMKLGIQEVVYNNYLSRMRKKGVLDKENFLPKFLVSIIPNDKFEFTVMFNIMDDE